MLTRRRFLQVLSVLVILSMMLSAFSMPAASAQSGDGIRRQHNTQTGKVSFIGPQTGRLLPASKALGISPSARPADPAMALAKRFGPEFGLKDPGRELTVLKTDRTADNRMMVHYQQNHQGIPVMGGELIVNTNDNADLYSINGEISPNLSLSTRPSIDPVQAQQTALQGAAQWYEKKPEDFVVSEPALWIYDASLLEPGTRPVELVWRMEVTAKDPALLVRELVLVNAQRGSLSLHFNQIDTSWSSTAKKDTSRGDDRPAAAPRPMHRGHGVISAAHRAEADRSLPGPNRAAAARAGVVRYVAPGGSDSNTCDLPAAPCLTIGAAITKSGADDIIKVAVGTYAPITVSKSLTLLGGWDNTFSSQTGYSTIQGTATVNGISASGAVVSVSRFVVQGSQYGINHTGGTLSFEQGALINNGNGIYNYAGNTNFTNVTISGNKASGTAGSAVSNVGGSIKIQSSTITNNSGSEAIRSVNGDALIEIGNTILAGNANGDCYVGNLNMTSTGYNLFGRSPACSGFQSPGFVPAATDQVGVDPQLGALFPLGYHAPLPTSPAVDHGNPASCPAVDQRGVTRPQGAACDVGSYEYTPPGPAASFGLVSGSNQHAGPSLPFQFPFVIYVIDASGSPASGVSVTFTAPLSGPSGTFADTGNNTTTVLTNDIGVATAPLFTANSQTGSYTVTATAAGLPGSISFALTNAVWFVSPSGSNGNSCNSPASPCLSMDGAMGKASGGDAIKVAAGTYAPIVISKSLTFLGGWNSTFTAQTGYSTIQSVSGVFSIVTGDNSVSFSRFIVQNGEYGIYHEGTGAVSFERGALLNNRYGLYTRGGDVTITNTTISGSYSSDTSGSAIRASSGTVRIRYSTITNNAGSYALYSTSSLSHIEIGNSILAGNTNADCYSGGSLNITSSGHNIFGRSPACSGPGIVPAATDQVGVNPQLSALFPAGYYPISPTSPAVDQGDAATCPASDQRGITRPQGAACDIGAYEYTAPGPAASFGVASGSNQHSGPSLSFLFPLVVYVMDDAGSPVSGVTVTFTAPLSGPSGTFADTHSNTTAALTNNSGLATASVFTTNSQTGSFTVTAAVAGLPGSASFALSNVAWYVTPTGSNTNSCNSPASPCLTINAAIGKASDGDGILVATGTYAPASLNKSLRLLGGWNTAFTSQSGYTTIQGSVTTDGISTSGANVSISRFVIRGSKYGINHTSGMLSFERGALIGNSNGIRNQYGDATVTNTTFSGNTGSSISGSAIANDFGKVSIRYSTITSNTGSYAVYSNGSARIEIGSTILAGNSGSDCYVGTSANMTSIGHNLFGRSPVCSAPSAFIPDATDQLAVDPQLSPLSPLGYHPIASSSPAVGQGDRVTCPASDQRGVTRPQGAGCDVGAYEYAATGTAASFQIASGTNQHTGPSLPFFFPLVVYVMDDAGSPVSGVSVTFTAPLSGPSGTFADTGNNITAALTNDSGLATASVLTANSQTGSYAVTATVSGLPGSLSFALANVVWFVSPTGSDTNSCNSPTSACLTINGAMGKAAEGDAIKVAIGTYTPINISKSLTLLGGWDTTFSSQTGYSRVDGNGTADGITVIGQYVSISGFIVQNSNYAILHNSFGTLSFARGALLHNSFGLYNSAGDVVFTNMTISGSTSAGIRNVSGMVRLQYATIANNTGSYGISSASPSAPIEIGNSILAGNSGSDCSTEFSNITSAGHNIFGRSPACSGTTSFSPDPTDRLGSNPQLSPLLPLGYHAIAPSSPAVDQANPAACPATDQRGLARPQGAGCDIGAYEFMAAGPAASFAILSGSNQRSGPLLPFPLPLTVYVLDAGGNPVGGVTVTFTAPDSGPGGTFADSGTRITTVLTNGVGLATSPAFTANSRLGSYNVTATAAGLPGSVSFALTNAAWFVSPFGSDTNSCALATSPCRTINAAIGKAADGDTILVEEGPYGGITISKSLTFQGGWNANFNAQTGYSTIQGSTNGVWIDNGNVSISRFIIQNNYHGIEHYYGSGLLQFDHGALINNSNALRNMSGDVIFTNVTISGNYIQPDEQGYYSVGSAISNVSGLIKVQYSTIINNGGSEGIYSNNGDAQIEIGNSILTDNPGGDCSTFANITSVGHNILSSSLPCGTYSHFVPHSTDVLASDPQLFPMLPDGYHPPKPGSLVIDAADPLSCPARDQRGVTRPVGTACDIGAFEYTAGGNTPEYILAYQGSPQIIPINRPAGSRLVALVFDADGDGVQGQTVTFTAPAQGASIIFASTGTSTATAVTDANGFATSPAFSANSLAGRYYVRASVNGAETSAHFSLGNSPTVLLPRIDTYTANNYVEIPGTFLCSQTKPGCTNGLDIQADAAHQYTIGTYALYAIDHNRHSIDNAGMTITSSVHLYTAYANAAWNGSQMVYGDGYGFALADDVVAHELTHGVTQYESNLFYYYQSGAINESLSDLWGEYYDQTNGLGNDSPLDEWLMGEDVAGLGAIRSFWNPPDFGDPDKMSSPNYYTGYRDNGGVHYNSGVNNKAVFLLVAGGSFNGQTVVGLGWLKVGAIYYEANTHLLSSGADYSDLYYALQQACTNLVGQKGITTGDCGQLKNGLDAVEMNGQPVADFNSDAPYCDQGYTPVTVFSDGLEAGTGNWTFNNGSYPRWQLDSQYGAFAHSGNHFLYADDYPPAATDASARLKPIAIPDHAYLRFAHAYDFQAYEASGYYNDGGVLEYSLDGGSFWQDAGSLIDFNRYDAILRSSLENPLQGRSAFAGTSHGYISTRVDLASLAGKSVTFRWRMGLDAGGFVWGWWLDDVEVYQCREDVTPPAAIADLTAASGPTTGTVTLHWTAPGDDGATGTTASYLVRYSSSAINSEAAWNAATLVTSGIPTPQAAGQAESMTVSGLTPDATYYFAVRAQDEVPYLAGLSNSPSAVAQTSLVPAGTYDDTDAHWLYSGTWTPYTGSSAYNGTWHMASASGSAAQITINGAKFKLTYVKAGNRGLIDVYVDGSKIAQINANSSSLAWQQTWTSPALAPGVHTVRFVHAGGGTYVDIDAIQVFDPVAAVGAGSYDDVDAAWEFGGSWTTYTGAGPANNTNHYSNLVGSDAQLTFNGNKFTLTYVKASNRGLIDVYVDGTKLVQINARASTLAWQATWTSPVLSSGVHTVRFVHAGGGTYIDVDAIQVFAPSDLAAPAAISDLAAAVGTATGSVDLSWTAPGDDNSTGIAASYLVRYSTAAITSDIEWNAATPVTTAVPAPLAAGTPQTMTVSGLTPGAVYFFAVRAQDEEANLGGLSNPASSAAQAAVPAHTGTYDDTDVNWSYSGAWAAYTGSGPANNTWHTASTAGSEASFTFDGTKFTFTYVKANNRGLIDVYVDGVKITQINARSAALTWQAAWTSPTFTPGPHTVRFVHAGGGTYIDVDAIQIFEPEALPAGTYDDTDTHWTYSGAWTAYTGTGPLNGSWHTAAAAGSEAEITFNGTGFTFTYVKAGNRGLIDVYVDGTKVGTIDASASALTWQVVWTSPAFTPGVHTVRFVHAGGAYIDVDAITVLP